MNNFLKTLALRPEISILLRRIAEINFKEQKSIINKHFLCSGGDKVLDLGCGTGEFSPFFPASQYTGVDIDPKNIQYALKAYKKKFLVADGKKLPFADNFFTKILVVGVFHHLSDGGSKEVAGEMKRVLRPGGEILVMEDTKNNALLTKLMHRLDQGDFIRSEGEWKKFFAGHFKMNNAWTFKNGLCFYSAFILQNEKR